MAAAMSGMTFLNDQATRHTEESSGDRFGTLKSKQQLLASMAEKMSESHSMSFGGDGGLLQHHPKEENMTSFLKSLDEEGSAMRDSLSHQSMLPSASSFSMNQLSSHFSELPKPPHSFLSHSSISSALHSLPTSSLPLQMHHHQMPSIFDHHTSMMSSVGGVDTSNHLPMSFVGHSQMLRHPSTLEHIGSMSHVGGMQGLGLRRLDEYDSSKLMSHELGMSTMSAPLGKLRLGRGDGKLDTLESHPSAITDLESFRNSGMPVLSSMLMKQPLRSRHDFPSMDSSNPMLGSFPPEEAPHPVSNWTQTDVMAWLDRIMLGNLRPTFQKHSISGDMLLSLEEEDLETDMNIHSRIIRRKLMRELNSLKGMSHMKDMSDGMEDMECDLSQCVVELNQVMHEEGLSQPKVARALGIQSQGHLSELLRGKYKHSRNSSAQHWAKEIRNFLALSPKERQDAISIYGQASTGKKRKSSKRTVWSKEQAMMLENFFRQKPSPSKPERQLLASQCGVDVGVINTYFQNKRRRSRHVLSPQL